MAEKIDKRTIQRIAELAKLSLKDDELDSMQEHFTKMIKNFQKLQELNLEGVEQLVNPHEGLQRMREDIPASGVDREEVLSAAPNRKDHFFRVPSPLKEVRKKQ